MIYESILLVFYQLFFLLFRIIFLIKVHLGYIKVIINLLLTDRLSFRFLIFIKKNFRQWLRHLGHWLSQCFVLNFLLNQNDFCLLFRCQLLSYWLLLSICIRMISLSHFRLIDYISWNKILFAWILSLIIFSLFLNPEVFYSLWLKFEIIIYAESRCWSCHQLKGWL